MPYRVVLFIGSFIGRLHLIFGHSQRKRAIRQIRDRMEISEEKAFQIARCMYRQIGRTFVEILYSPVCSPLFLERHVTIENEYHLRSALDYGRGVVIATAHFGNWEWMGARLALAGFPMAAIAKEQPSGLDRLLNEYRLLVGIEPFARGSALTAAMKTLRKGKVLGFLADQDGREEGIFVKFFNVDTSTPRGPALFAIRTGAPIVPAFIIRHGRGHRILLHPPLYPGQDCDEEATMRVLTAQMVQALERRIRQYPDHWWWFQRRWLTQRKTEESVSHE